MEYNPIPIDKNSRKSTVESWVDQYGDAIYAKAFHMTLSRDIAQDIVQETFIAAFTSFEQCHNKDKPKSWLFTILRNKAMDHFRETAKRPMPVDLESEQKVDDLFNANGRWKNPSSEQDEPELLDTPEFNKMLALCIEKLPVMWKRSILAKYILGKKGKEICQELNISPDLYWQSIHRAKLSLRSCIKQNWRINE